MKALSLKQPFAELIVSGRKRNELRNWNTKFRGEFFVHASKKVNTNAMNKFDFEELPLGCIVGKAKLVEVKKYSDSGEFSEDKDLHLGSDFEKYGFVLKDVKKIESVFCKGKLGFWEVKCL